MKLFVYDKEVSIEELKKIDGENYSLFNIYGVMK